MKVATYEGIIRDGHVQLSENIRLPDKTKVYVIVPDGEVQALAHLNSPRLRHLEQADDFTKKVVVELDHDSL